MELFDKFREPINLPHQRHSDTSQAAAEQAEPTAETKRGLVLQAIRELGGATDEQIQQRLEMNPSTQRPRRVELVNAGLVFDGGLRRLTQAGRRAVVWQAK